jgi:phosphate-selective porin OprO/OprP
MLMKCSPLYFFLSCGALVFLISSSCLFAQEAIKEADPAGSNSDRADPVANETHDDEVNRAMADSVRLMFQERESPLLHIRWGTRVYLDIPIGNEPAGASPTLRKAELKLSKAFGKNFQVKLSGNYVNNEFKAGDSYLVYSGWRAAILTAGVQDPPFSLEASGASSAITFMESALPVNALSENKNAGVDFLRRTSRQIFNVSWVFYNPRQQGVSEIGQALVARYVYSPVNFHGRENIHLGGSLSYRFLDSNAEVQLQSRPEVATANVSYVNTGNIDDGKAVLRAGLEASQIIGRFSWQSEVLASRVQRNNAEPLEFWGAYFHLSQFLTNDSRNYDQGSGTFVNVVPGSPVGAGGLGAFEVAFRASYVDLTDKDIVGGRESNLSLGFNWYLDEKFRVMANVIKVLNVDRPGSEYDGLDPLIFALRAQWLIY